MSAQIEAPPALTAKEIQYILRHPADAQIEALLRESNARYAYWTDIKYRHKALEEPFTLGVSQVPAQGCEHSYFATLRASSLCDSTDAGRAV